MPEIYHPDWTGINVDEIWCEKHGVATLRCEKCINERRPGFMVYLTEHDRDMLAEDPDMTPAGLFPEGQEWLAEQIMD